MRNPYAPPKSNAAMEAHAPVNWGKVVVYSTILFVAQVAIGFFEGSFDRSGARLLGGAAGSFLICGAIFAHLSAHQLSRPFVHAWTVLLLQELVALLLVRVFMPPDPQGSYLFVALDYLSLMAALGIGTMVGIRLRLRSRRPHGAQQAVAADRPKTGAG
jgi:hypothetical protein